VLVYAVVAPLRGLPAHWPSEWWLYAGGLLGILFVLASVAVVRAVGVLMLGVGSIAGQVLASLAFDLIVPARGDHLAANTVVGRLAPPARTATACSQNSAPPRS
jgi:transporter family-2 protein